MKRMKGFSLMELMIAVAIIAILAGVAYPSYQDQVRKSRRADAKIALAELNQSLERFFTTNNTYLGATLGDGSVATDIYPQKSADGHYNLSISTQTASTFTLTASATGNQASDSQCASYTLTHTGIKGGTSGGPEGGCW